MTVLTGTNFETEINDTLPVFVDFYANWCGPCKMMAPIVEQLESEYAGKMKFAKCDIDENMGIAQKYRIMSIPTFIIFKNGEPVDAIVGGCSKGELEAKIKAKI